MATCSIVCLHYLYHYTNDIQIQPVGSYHVIYIYMRVSVSPHRCNMEPTHINQHVFFFFFKLRYVMG